MEFFTRDYRRSDFRDGDRIDYQKVTYQPLDKELDHLEIQELVDKSAFVFDDEIKYFYLALQVPSDNLN